MFPFAVGALALTLTAPAKVQPGVDWNAPSDCPSAAAVQRVIAKRLGVHRELPPALRIRAIVEKRDDSFRLDLTLATEQQTERRSLVERDCRVLARAVALILTELAESTAPREPSPGRLAAIPETRRLEPDPSPHEDHETTRPDATSPTPVEPRPPAGTQPAAPARSPFPRSRAPSSNPPSPQREHPSPQPRRWRGLPTSLQYADLRSGAQLALALGTDLSLPAPVHLAARVSSAFVYRRHGWGLRLGFHYRQRRISSDQYGLVLHDLTGSLAGCIVPGRGRVSVPSCVGVELGSVLPRVTGGDPGPATRDGILSAHARMDVGMDVAVSPHLDLWARLDLSRPLHHYQLIAGPAATTLYSTPALRLGIAIGASLHFLTRKSRPR